MRIPPVISYRLHVAQWPHSLPCFGFFLLAFGPPGIWRASGQGLLDKAPCVSKRKTKGQSQRPPTAHRNATVKRLSLGGVQNCPGNGLYVLSCRGSRRPTSSNLLPPGPPPFIFSFIPACLFGVGLKGVGWTRTENGISRSTY